MNYKDIDRLLPPTDYSTILNEAFEENPPLFYDTQAEIEGTDLTSINVGQLSNFDCYNVSLHETYLDEIMEQHICFGVELDYTVKMAKVRNFLTEIDIMREPDIV